MSLSTRFLPALALAAVLVGPAWAAKDDPAESLDRITQSRVAGTPQRCISLFQGSNTQIVDKTTIAYRVGNTWYVNQLKSGASSLDDDDILVTRTFGSQLCEMDSVDLIDRYTRGYRGFVILGPFVPYAPPRKAP
ncbi:hypothetical protein P3W33_15040 [Luteibacter sp. PPL552]